MCSDIPILGNGILDIGIKNFNILLNYSVENNYKQAKWESGAAYETGQEWRKIETDSRDAINMIQWVDTCYQCRHQLHPLVSHSEEENQLLLSGL